MKKIDYEKAINEAKNKGELIGVIIARSHRIQAYHGRHSASTTTKSTCEC